MTSEQFVFWLRGYLGASNNNVANLTRGDWTAVQEMLKVVVTPQADAEVRRIAQERLRKERDDFLRQLDDAQKQSLANLAQPPMHGRGL